MRVNSGSGGGVASNHSREESPHERGGHWHHMGSTWGHIGAVSAPSHRHPLGRARAPPRRLGRQRPSCACHNMIDDAYDTWDIEGPICCGRAPHALNEMAANNAGVKNSA